MKYSNAGTSILSSTQVALKKMLYPPFLKDVLTTVLQTNLPLFLVLSFILNVLQMAKNLAYEKEKKLKVLVYDLLITVQFTGYSFSRYDLLNAVFVIQGIVCI